MFLFYCIYFTGVSDSVFYTYCGLKVYYEKIGKGIPIIFLHGWGCSTETFKVVAKDIVEKYTVYLIDFPGFGRSIEPDFIINIKGMADLLNSFICDLNIVNPIIVGHSYGGRVAGEYASKNENISKLILIDSAGIKRFKFNKFFKIKIYKFKKWFYKVTKRLMKYNELISKSGSVDYINSSFIKKKMLVEAVNYDQKKVFAKVRCETLLLWGEKDYSTPLKDGIKISKLIKNSDIVIIPSAGHFPFIENYSYFIKVLKSFLEV